MIKPLIRNTLVVLFYTILWLFIDLIDVKLFKIPGHKYGLLITLSIVLVSFIYVNKGLLQDQRPFYRGVVILSICMGLTAIWFIFATTILVEFHVSIGGHI